MDEQTPGNPPFSEEQNPGRAASSDGSSYVAEIDPTYAQSALNKIKTILKGNGVKKDDIALESFDGAVLEFLAVTLLDLKVKVTEKREAGKVQGSQQVDNDNVLRENIKQEQAKIRGSGQHIQQIKDFMLQRDDKGFAFHNELIKLPFLSKSYVIYEACNTCQAKGSMKCQRCHGQGYEECPRCHAVGLEVCPQCQGNGQIMGSNNQYQPCPRCHGQKKIACSLCQQTKRIQCSVCKTKGTTVCTHCNGHAWNSKISMMDVEAIGNFDYARDKVPEKINALINRLGAKLIKHVEIMPVTKEREEGGDIIALPYAVRIPHGDVKFKIKDEIIEGFAFGTQCKLLELPYFLEKILAPGSEALARAAKGQGSVDGHLKKALKYKTIKHAVIAASKFPPEKALKAVLKRTPLGIHQKSVAALIENANQALKNMTGKAKHVSIAVGVVIGGSIAGAYFIGPLRGVAQAQIANPQVSLAIDALVSVLAIGVGYMTAKMWMQGARQKALKNLLP